MIAPIAVGCDWAIAHLENERMLSKQLNLFKSQQKK